MSKRERDRECASHFFVHSISAGHDQDWQRLQPGSQYGPSTQGVGEPGLLSHLRDQ